MGDGKPLEAIRSVLQGESHWEQKGGTGWEYH